MLTQWAPALVFLALSAIIPIAAMTAAWLFRVEAKVHEPAKFDTYECGEELDGKAWIRFHPRYYIVALVFVLFDAELAFLFPWALNVRSLGVMAVGSMFVFIAILMLGWFYAVRKGALRWQ